MIIFDIKITLGLKVVVGDDDDGENSISTYQDKY